MKAQAPKVVRVTSREFELEDGRVFEHPVPLNQDEVPTRSEFQEHYDHWYSVLYPEDERQITKHTKSM
jgi:hypothetical protein